MPQGDHLEHTFSSEEDDENQVYPVQNIIHLLCLVVGFHHHGHHVQADQDHNDNVKGLFGDKVKDDALKLVLEGSTEK